MLYNTSDTNFGHNSRVVAALEGVVQELGELHGRGVGECLDVIGDDMAPQTQPKGHDVVVASGFNTVHKHRLKDRYHTRLPIELRKQFGVRVEAILGHLFHEVEPVGHQPAINKVFHVVWHETVLQHLRRELPVLLVPHGVHKGFTEAHVATEDVLEEQGARPEFAKVAHVHLIVSLVVCAQNSDKRTQQLPRTNGFTLGKLINIWVAPLKPLLPERRVVRKARK